MAKIIKKGRALEKELSDYKNQIKKRDHFASFLFIIGIFGGLLSFCLEQVAFLLLSAIFWISAACVIMSNTPLQKEIDILEAGVAGENLANRCVGLLPETYTVFRNLTITCVGKNSEIDFLVVGPSGVFVVETKNSNGEILGDINDKNWVQHKIGRAGTPYGKQFYNPVKQVKTHACRTRDFLKENGINKYVNAIVYFSNFDALNRTTGNDPKTEIFFASNDGAEKMLRFILDNNERLSFQECNEIINLFKNI